MVDDRVVSARYQRNIDGTWNLFPSGTCVDKLSHLKLLYTVR